jgi:hypothetical protein
MRVQNRAARPLGKSAETNIAHAADVIAGNLGTARDPIGVGGDGEHDALLVLIQRPGVLCPALTDMIADGAALGGTE